MSYTGKKPIDVVDATTAQTLTIEDNVVTPSINGGQIGGRRNLIINGAMTVSQRGTSQTGVGYNAGYFDAPDRFRINNISQAVWTLSQSTEAPDGFAHSYKWDCTTADTSVAADHEIELITRLEGQDLQHLKKGTSGAVSLTLSFWVRSAKTGTYIVELKDHDNSRAISKSYTIDTADTWEKKEITYAGDTTGAFTNDANLSLGIFFWLGAGSNYTSGTLATSWESQTNANRAVGQVNLGDSTSNDWYITGVQLEVGSVATEFEHRSYGEELALCQRYYQIWSVGWSGYASVSGQNISAQCNFNTTMRTTPTVTRTGGYAPTRYPASAAFIINQDVDGFVGGSVSQSLGGNDNWRHDGTAEAEL